MSDQSGSQSSRRTFLKVLGGAGAGLYVAAVVPGKFLRSAEGAVLASSEGYLLVDTKKCQGCVSCMLVCSLAHEGAVSFSLSRIQIVQNSFEKWPDDVAVAQCRQCTEPLCLEACPTGALHVESEEGNVKTVDERKCIGCMQCIQACPFTPSRMEWNFEGRHAQKCDLCIETPYHWDEAGGGPNGKQACVEVCPVNAIQFTTEVPDQEGDAGYSVNLRDENWKKLGFPID